MATALATLQAFLEQELELDQIQSRFEQDTVPSDPRAACLLRDYASAARGTEAEWRHKVESELRSATGVLNDQVAARLAYALFDRRKPGFVRHEQNIVFLEAVRNA